MQAYFIDHDIDLTQIKPLVYAPAAWSEQLHTSAAEQAIQLAESIAQGTQTPWILSSGTMDLEGRPRTESASHVNGTAWDIAPMYSTDIILPADPPLSCLAVNWAFLSILAPYLLAFPKVAVVEGDHIHVLNVDKPVGLDSLVLSVPTVSTAYSLSEAMTLGPVPLLFDRASLTLGPKVNSMSALDLLRQCVVMEEE